MRLVPLGIFFENFPRRSTPVTFIGEYSRARHDDVDNKVDFTYTSNYIENYDGSGGKKILNSPNHD